MGVTMAKAKNYDKADDLHQKRLDLWTAMLSFEKVSSVDLLAEGLPAVRGRLNDVQERISLVDDVQHLLMAYESRVNRAITMLQAIELEKKND